MSEVSFRDFLHLRDHPRVARLRGVDAYEHAAQMRLVPELQRNLLEPWAQLITEPFRGISSDGQIQGGLFRLEPNDAPVPEMTAAAAHLIDALTPAERSRLCRPMDAQEWRMWNNTEIYFFPYGLRLDEVSHAAREAVLAVIRASLSPEGYDKVRHLMRLNQFLGDLLEAPRVLGEWSYNFTLFGQPSTGDPWGWQLQGHHIALNIVVVGEQMLGTPVFLGAEPNQADHGPLAGRRAFQDEEQRGLELMLALPETLQGLARVYDEMVDPRMPPGRWHPDDQRQLGGAFQDNRVIPYEGAPVSAFARAHREQLLTLIEAYLAILPAGPRSAKLDEIERHLDSTHWCWIGKHDHHNPFYYRIQSPVIMIEFDHHSGIFLANESPEKFHVHTIVRTPNGNDYGLDVLRQHYATVHTHNH